MYNHLLVNNDTDSVSIMKQDRTPWTLDEQQSFLDELNNLFPELINFANDGYFKRFIVLKSKNYILYDGKKIKTKGSSIRDQKKEPALLNMIDDIVNALVFDATTEDLRAIYHKYIHEAMNVTDIKRWCSKKTITESILDCRGWTPEDVATKRLRMNEISVWEAIKHLDDIQSGNKCYVFPTKELISRTETIQKNGKVKVKEEYSYTLKELSQWNGTQDNEHLVDRVYKTLEIFSKVLDMNAFIDYTVKKNKHLLEML